MEITIREAGESDFEHVSAVFLDELAFHAELLPNRFQLVDESMTEEWFQEIVHNQEKELILAQLGPDVVGVLHIEMRTSPDLPFFVPRRYAHVSDIAVIREHRFRGYGRFLMRRAIAWANEHEADSIELHVWEQNKDAFTFYDRLGFSVVQRTMQFDLLSSQ
jgi:ribosomal protein S18 acetylase RimI-like enzyme